MFKYEFNYTVCPIIPAFASTFLSIFAPRLRIPLFTYTRGVDRAFRLAFTHSLRYLVTNCDKVDSTYDLSLSTRAVSISAGNNERSPRGEKAEGQWLISLVRVRGDSPNARRRKKMDIR